MPSPWKIIKELETDNSRLFKESVVEKNLNDKNFQEGLAMCLDPLVTFGVKQVPESNADGKGLEWEDFKKAANLYNHEKCLLVFLCAALDCYICDPKYLNH